MTTIIFDHRWSDIFLNGVSESLISEVFYDVEDCQPIIPERVMGWTFGTTGRAYGKKCTRGAIISRIPLIFLSSNRTANEFISRFSIPGIELVKRSNLQPHGFVK